MRILNLGCGATRPQNPTWVNLDNLHQEFRIIGRDADAARENLDKETNYHNHDVLDKKLPFQDRNFDGVLASHFFEHFNAQIAVTLMEECRRILTPGGILVVSVPDAQYFRAVNPRDNKENSKELFDEQLTLENPHESFFAAALWYEQHMALFTEDVLWCYLVRAGFAPSNIWRGAPDGCGSAAAGEIRTQINRPRFSLIMSAIRHNP